MTEKIVTVLSSTGVAGDWNYAKLQTTGTIVSISKAFKAGTTTDPRIDQILIQIFVISDRSRKDIANLTETF